MTVAVLGTGQLGAALSRALARADVPLAIGSRDLARAEALAARLRSEVPGARVEPGDCRGAARLAEAVVVAVDFDGAQKVLAELRGDLAGRIVVDPTTPWGDRIPATSASQELARVLPAGAPLVAAWKTTFAGELSLAAPALTPRQRPAPAGGREGACATRPPRPRRPPRARRPAPRARARAA